MSVREPRIDLVPWDHDSSAHVERMYIQRLACGWRSEDVRSTWIELSRAGKKTLYWVVLRDGLSEKEHILNKHLAENPNESIPIQDTAPAHWHTPRQPSCLPITPIGHIALELRPEQNAALPPLPALASSLPNIVWVSGLFVSHSLQAGGFGREVMRAAESIAVQELKADWITLDTIAREQQLSGQFVRAMYLAQGQPVPTRAAQDWYERQGYVAFAEEKGSYRWVSPITGETEDIHQIYLRKKLVAVAG